MAAAAEEGGKSRPPLQTCVLLEEEPARTTVHIMSELVLTPVIKESFVERLRDSNRPIGLSEPKSPRRHCLLDGEIPSKNQFAVRPRSKEDSDADDLVRNRSATLSLSSVQPAKESSRIMGMSARLRSSRSRGKDAPPESSTWAALDSPTRTSTQADRRSFRSVLPLFRRRNKAFHIPSESTGHDSLPHSRRSFERRPSGASDGEEADLSELTSLPSCSEEASSVSSEFDKEGAIEHNYGFNSSSSGTDSDSGSDSDASESENESDDEDDDDDHSTRTSTTATATTSIFSASSTSVGGGGGDCGSLNYLTAEEVEEESRSLHNRRDSLFTQSWRPSADHVVRRKKKEPAMVLSKSAASTQVGVAGQHSYVSSASGLIDCLASIRSDGDALPSTLDAQTTVVQINEGFQSVREVIDEFRYGGRFLSVSDRVSEAFRQVTDIAADFAFAVETYGRIIVNEMNLPDEQRTIRVNAKFGGVAGGKKYCVAGILFKFATDSSGLYGGDHFSAKAAKHELNSLIAFSRAASGCPEIGYPLMALLDVRGHRLIASSLVPLSPSSLIYGSTNGGQTVVDRDPGFSRKWARIATSLNLKAHRSSDPSLETPIHGPSDMEAHRGSDGRYYVLDLARLFPPEHIPDVPNPNGQSLRRRGQNLYALLRPELVTQWSCPLSSDVFSSFGRINSAEHNADVVAVSQHILNSRIPAFAQYLDALPLEVCQAYPETFSIVKTLHTHGLNIRHLGHIWMQCLSQPWRAALALEIVARVTKNLMNALLREIVLQSGARLAQTPFRIHLARFLSLALFHPDPDRKTDERLQYQQFCARVLLPALHEQFPVVAGASSFPLEFDRRHLYFRLNRMTGLRLTDDALKNRVGMLEAMLYDHDVAEEPCQIRCLGLVDLARGLVDIQKASQETVDNAKYYTRSAIDYFSRALVGNSSDWLLLWCMGEAFIRACSLLANRERAETLLILATEYFALATHYFPAPKNPPPPLPSSSASSVQRAPSIRVPSSASTTAVPVSSSSLSSSSKADNNNNNDGDADTVATYNIAGMVDCARRYLSLIPDITSQSLHPTAKGVFCPTIGRYGVYFTLTRDFLLGHHLLRKYRPGLVSKLPVADVVSFDICQRHEYAAVATRQNQLQLWKISHRGFSQKLACSFPSLANVRLVRFLWTSAQGHLLAAVSSLGVLALWKLGKAGQPVGPFCPGYWGETQQGTVTETSLLCRTSGSYLVVAYDRHVYLFHSQLVDAALGNSDATLPAPLEVLPAGRAVRALWSAGRDWICSGNEDGSIRLWQFKDGVGYEMSVLKGHASCVSAIEGNVASSLLMSGDVEGTLRVWHLATRTCVRVVDRCCHAKEISSIYLFSDHKILLISTTGVWQSWKKEPKDKAKKEIRAEPDPEWEKWEEGLRFGLLDLHTQKTLVDSRIGAATSPKIHRLASRRGMHEFVSGRSFSFLARQVFDAPK